MKSTFLIAAQFCALILLVPSALALSPCAPWSEGKAYQPHDRQCAGIPQKSDCQPWEEERHCQIGDIVLFEQKAFRDAGWTPAPASSLWSGNAHSKHPIIGAEGGTVSKPGLIQLQFPAGALSQATPITIFASQDEEINDTFLRSAEMFDASKRSRHELRVILSTQQPLLPIRITLPIPQELQDQLSAQDEVRILYLNKWDDGNEAIDSFEALAERGHPTATHINSQLPETAFYENAQGQYEATILPSATPTARALPKQARQVRKAKAAPLDATIQA